MNDGVLLSDKHQTYDHQPLMQHYTYLIWEIKVIHQYKLILHKSLYVVKNDDQSVVYVGWLPVLFRVLDLYVPEGLMCLKHSDTDS